jgi:type II secretory pathway component PulJ
MEVLVALALVSTIVTMVYGSYFAASRSVDLYSSRMACCDRTCLVLRLMARQLRCVYLPSSATDPTATSSQSSTSTVPTTVPQTEPLDASGDTLSFVTTAGQGAGLDRATALMQVTYRHDSLSGTLSISSEPYVCGAGSLQDSPSGQVILTGIRSMEVQFYDGRQWQPGWTGGDSQTLPQGVKITLTVMDEQNRSQEFETMAPIGCRSAPRTQQISTGAATH